MSVVQLMSLILSQKNCLEVIDGVINDIRESVKYIKGSTSTKEKFEEVIVGNMP